MKLELDSKVYLDLIEIMEYYDEEAGTDVAAKFYAEFRQYAKAAVERPYSFPQHGELRRANLHRFPHHFLYKIVNEITVRVLVVRHNRRHPDFGLDR